MRIYFDNAATTPMHPEVIKKITHLMQEVNGNPSSIHQAGRKARAVVEDARKTCAKLLNASIGEIYFTGSATEANNMIIRRCVKDLEVSSIITSPTEHPCVMNTAKEVEEQNNVKLNFLTVNNFGLLDLKELEQQLADSTEKTLVSIMHINNELGSVQDIEAIGELCNKYGALFHCDAVQGIAKIKYDLQKLNIDFLSAAGHKFHGPKGVGFMYIKNDHRLKPFITGGGQERSMRSGTENVHGIAGIALAFSLYHDKLNEKYNTITELKSLFKSKLKAAVPDVTFIEDDYPSNTISTILSVSFPESPKTELMTFNLDIAGIAASAGSACASGVENTSHVLEAVGFPEDRRAVRFSFSYFNTKEEVHACIEKIANIFKS